MYLKILPRADSGLGPQLPHSPVKSVPRTLVGSRSLIFYTRAIIKAGSNTIKIN